MDVFSGDELSELIKLYQVDPAGCSVNVRKAVNDFRLKSRERTLPEEWRNFVIEMVSLSFITDRDLCRYLIDFAQELDDKYACADMRDSTLYESIIEVYPEVISVDDIMRYYEKNVRNQTACLRFCHIALEHIRKAEDASFAIDLFNALVKTGEVTYAGIYLKELLNDRYVAESVLNRSFFKSNKSGKLFAKSVEKFVKKNKLGFDYQSTLVWINVLTR